MSRQLEITQIAAWKGSRRRFTGTAAGGALAATASVAGVRAQPTPGATPAASPVVAGDGRYLLVGDRTQTTIEISTIPGFALAGTVENVGFGTHGGMLQLPDGRVVFSVSANTTRSWPLVWKRMAHR